eukprot:c18504_g1_i1 orf=102-284(-)
MQSVVFDELPSWDVAMCTVLIAEYAQHGRGDDALRCISPNAITYVCILKSLWQHRTNRER